MSSKITIPAVKITDAVVPSLPMLPDDELFAPDAILSEVKLDPMDDTLFTEATDGNHAAEFGEFLLDAVDWL